MPQEHAKGDNLVPFILISALKGEVGRLSPCIHAYSVGVNAVIFMVYAF
jgi:hypothetical protein